MWRQYGCPMWKVTGLRLYGWSVAVALVLMAVVGAIASLPGCDKVWLVLLPGALLAAVAFPQGVNSAGGNAYLVVAGVLDALLFALPVMLCWKLIGSKRRAEEGGI